MLFSVPKASQPRSRGLLSHRRAPRAASVYPALAAIFAAQFYGIHLDFTQYLLIVLVSVLGSAATAGTTGAIVMLTLTLSTLGLPLDGVGLLMAIDPIIDMGRTALNVAGQALVPAVVARREGIWTRPSTTLPAPRVASCRRRCTRSRWPTSRSACRWPRLARPARSAKSGALAAPRGRF